VRIEVCSAAAGHYAREHNAEERDAGAETLDVILIQLNILKATAAVSWKLSVFPCAVTAPVSHFFFSQSSFEWPGRATLGPIVPLTLISSGL
jgi:hypothetical protein